MWGGRLNPKPRSWALDGGLGLPGKLKLPFGKRCIWVARTASTDMYPTVAFRAFLRNPI